MTRLFTGASTGAGTVAGAGASTLAGTGAATVASTVAFPPIARAAPSASER